MKVIIVAFKVDEDDSVYYKKVELPTDDRVEAVALLRNQLGHYLHMSYEKGADFVSVRFVRTEHKVTAG